jgi:hypothetical protein
MVAVEAEMRYAPAGKDVHPYQVTARAFDLVLVPGFVTHGAAVEVPGFDDPERRAHSRG